MAYEDIIESASKQFRLDPDLIRAFIKQESNWKADATRYEPKLKDTSYGLMQVLHGTAKWVGDNTEITAAQLSQPVVNIMLGAKYLRYLLDKYKQNLNDAIASYNAGKPYRTTFGKYINQAYVNSVLKHYNTYKFGYWTTGIAVILSAGLLYFFYTRKKP